MSARPWEALVQIAAQVDRVKGRRFDDPEITRTLARIAKIIDAAEVTA
jgi:hypothetical protein